jgi:D-alanyl-D-alanine carboxypeptidase/D-alanyl-D-alanine-endopeptidase (penicillin-binding protein 4)
MRIFFVVFSIAILLSSCSVSKQLARSAKHMVLQDSSLLNAHVGISVYDPSTGKYLFDYNGDKYFVPASNTKLPTCYAAMKYLGDSLLALRYAIPVNPNTHEPLKILVIQPTGDPSFLVDDFSTHPAFDFIKKKWKDERYAAAFIDTSWREEVLGSGWSWNDYENSYMAERSSFPIFGNVLKVTLRDSMDSYQKEEIYPDVYLPYYLKTQSTYFDSLVNAGFRTGKRSSIYRPPFGSLHRHLGSEKFYWNYSTRKFSGTNITFATNGVKAAFDVLADSFKVEFGLVHKPVRENIYPYDMPYSDYAELHIREWKELYSQPTDSLLRIMMHRSDNFFAEQSLLMVSNQHLGIMNVARITDTLLKTTLKDLPQAPRWADGSGLSRYNLFSPRDFVTILNKMKEEFGMERIKTILPTGNEGTLAGLYIKDSGYIFAKTGTLTGVVALSGFVYTNKNKLLIFSMLVNNHRASATAVRKAYQKFIQEIREKY